MRRKLFKISEKSSAQHSGWRILNQWLGSFSLYTWMPEVASVLFFQWICVSMSRRLVQVSASISKIKPYISEFSPKDKFAPSVSVFPLDFSLLNLLYDSIQRKQALNTEVHSSNWIQKFIFYKKKKRNEMKWKKKLLAIHRISLFTMIISFQL